jgi:hypothetical protein
MLTTIDLDHKPGRKTYEIGEIGSDRQLAPKLEAAQAPSAQVVPNTPLGPAHVFPQIPGSLRFG